jgi:transposase-like protein
MYEDRYAEGDVTQAEARREVGALLGINPETMRNWIRRERGEGATAARVAGPVDPEVVELRKEVARLKRANEILKTASAFFASAELDRRLGS